MKYTIGLPSGIGDYSWGFSKLYSIRDQIKQFKIADGWPHRTTGYVRLCWTPEERLAREHGGATYGSFTYQEILASMNANGFSAENATNGKGAFTWEDVQRECGGHSEILLEPNRHLELGRPLHTWLPDLPTQYHYPLYTSKEAARFAGELTGSLKVSSKVTHGDTPLVGISCASYRGSEAWETWNSDAWCEFLTLVMQMGWQPVILGGFWDDLSSNVAARLGLPDFVGRTDTEQMVEILRRLDSYIGFSSGLGVVRTVLNKPALSLWPDFQKELSTAWAPPDMLESGRYVAAPYRDPTSDVFPIAKRFLTLCEEESRREKEDQAKRWKEEAAQEKRIS